MKRNGRESFKQKTAKVGETTLHTVKWYNCSVSLLSDYIGPVTKVDRLNGKQKKAIKVPCPAVVREYNKNMGGVDLLDSLIALYRKKIRSKKWYHRLMFHYRYDHRNCLAILQERLQQHWDEKRGTDEAVYIQVVHRRKLVQKWKDSGA